MSRTSRLSRVLTTSSLTLLGLGLAPTGAALAQAPPAQAAAQAQAALPITVDGDFWTRFELRDNYAGIGASQGRFQEGDAFFYRARLGVWGQGAQFRGDHHVAPRFVLQSSGVQGTMGGTINDAAVGVHEAFVRWSGPMHRLDFGRFEMAYGDHAIIGNLGWHQTARSWDGVRARLSKDAKGPWVDVFMTLARPDAVPGEKHPAFDELFEGDDWFGGVYADIGPMLAKDLTLELYSLFQIQVGNDGGPGVDRDGAVLATVGTRVVQPFGKTRVRFEGTGQLGKDLAQRDTTAFQADLEIMQTLSEAFNLSVGALYASGDDPDTEENEGFNHLYSTAHKFLGLMDIIGTRTNVMSGSVKAAYKIGKTTTLKADGHVFFRPQAVGEIEDYAGSEIDLNLVQGIGGGLGVRALYALFLPTDSYASSDPAHYVAVQLGYAFK